MGDLEAAGAGVAVHHAEVPQEPQFSHHEMVGGMIGQALVAAHRRRLGTKRSIGKTNHVSARVAHGEIFVKGEDDSALR